MSQYRHVTPHLYLSFDLQGAQQNFVVSCSHVSRVYLWWCLPIVTHSNCPLSLSLSPLSVRERNTLLFSFPCRIGLYWPTILRGFFFFFFGISKAFLRSLSIVNKLNCVKKQRPFWSQSAKVLKKANNLLNNLPKR